MTQANPFAASLPSVPAATREPPVLPLYLAGIAVLVGVVGMVVMLAGLLGNSVVENPLEWVLRYLLRHWLGHMLLSGLCVYWVTLTYLERRGLGDYRQPGSLLIAYGLACLALSWLGGYAMSYLVMWRYEQLSGGMLVNLLWWGLELLRFGIETVLPLLLLLHLFRHTASAVAEPVRMAGQALAWLFALGVVVAYLQVADLTMQLLAGLLYSHEMVGWEGLFALGQGLLCLPVAFFAARGALPKAVCGFRGGRLALAGLITLLLWIAVAAAFAALLLVAMLAGFRYPVYLVIGLGLVQLAVLWPFTRLGLRWGYRAQAAA